MKRLLKFVRLSRADQGVLIKAGLLLLAIRLGLLVISFPTLLRMLRSWGDRRSFSRDFDPDEARKAIWAIERVNPHIPGASCLTQALAALALLGRMGQSAFLRIGVVREEPGGLSGHAWVEAGGKAVIGNHSDLSRYTVLTSAERQ